MGVKETIVPIGLDSISGRPGENLSLESGVNSVRVLGVTNARTGAAPAGAAREEFSEQFGCNYFTMGASLETSVVFPKAFTKNIMCVTFNVEAAPQAYLVANSVSLTGFTVHIVGAAVGWTSYIHWSAKGI